jgi:hypothetical protein
MLCAGYAAASARLLDAPNRRYAASRGATFELFGHAL